MSFQRPDMPTFAARCQLVPGVANPLSARIAEDLGYENLYVTGAGVTNFAMGVPDIGLMPLNDTAEAVTAIRAVVDLPLMVDADTGFGNPAAWVCADAIADIAYFLCSEQARAISGALIPASRGRVN